MGLLDLFALFLRTIPLVNFPFVVGFGELAISQTLDVIFIVGIV